MAVKMHARPCKLKDFRMVRVQRLPNGALIRLPKWLLENLAQARHAALGTCARYFDAIAHSHLPCSNGSTRLQSHRCDMRQRAFLARTDLNPASHAKRPCHKLPPNGEIWLEKLGKLQIVFASRIRR